MAGQAITIADAVVTAINAKVDYSNSFTPSATRKMLVNLKANREDITGLNVWVVPGGFASTVASEDRYSDDYRIRVFVADEVAKGDNSDDYNESEISNLLTLVEEIQTQVIQYADSNPSTLKTTGQFTNDPLVDDEYLEQGTFLSVTEFTFRNHREV